MDFKSDGRPQFEMVETILNENADLRRQNTQLRLRVFELQKAIDEMTPDGIRDMAMQLQRWSEAILR